MRRVRLLLLVGIVMLFSFGFAAPPAGACPPYNGGSCSPGGCRLVGGSVDPESGTIVAPYLECYY